MLHEACYRTGELTKPGSVTREELSILSLHTVQPSMEMEWLLILRETVNLQSWAKCKMFQLEMKHECRQEHHPYRIRKNVGMSLGLHIPLHQFHKNEFPPINPWRVQGLWISRIILIAGLFHRFSKLKPPVSPHLRLSLFADLGLKEGCKVFLCE